MSYLVAIDRDIDAPGIDLASLESIASRALAAEHVAEPAELSIMVTGDERIRELNRTYRDTDAPTDVLAFAQSEGDQFAQPEGAPPHLGDVVISLDTAARQAGEFSIPLGDELSHLLVHGILHLLGYDHETEDEAATMRAHENAILGEAHHH
jgi:probable rRNA maturation factor